MEIELFKGSDSFMAELSVDIETGEIIDDYLGLLVSRNPIGTCAFILNSTATVEMIDSHIKKLEAKTKYLKNNIERAKEELKYVMQKGKITKVESLDKTFKAVLSIARDCSVNVYDESLLPKDMVKLVPESYVPDKVLIKKALQDKLEIQGANLVFNDRLTIS